LKELVRLEGVTKQFRNASVRAIDGISMVIDKGEFVVIRGPSGSGKSTLLNLIAGLTFPSEGTVYLDGEAPRGRERWAKIRAEKIGFIFQAFNLLPTLTALENVQVPMLGIIRNPRERKRRAHELLASVGLEHRMNHKPAELSGGECQRVAIARGLANSPLMILADEPTGNLDSTNSLAIMALIKRVYESGKRTIIAVTHDSIFTSCATRILFIRDGRLRERAPVGLEGH